MSCRQRSGLWGHIKDGHCSLYVGLLLSTTPVPKAMHDMKPESLD